MGGSGGQTQGNECRLEIYTLGRFQVQCGDCLVSDLSRRSKKLWDLFKYLLTHNGKRIPPATVAESLWPDQETQDPNAALHSLLYRLRRLFREVVPECEQAFTIEFSHGSYCLELRPDSWVDVREFSRLSRQAADRAAVDPAEAVEIYRQALSLYQGHYLPENSSEVWLLPSCHYYRRLFHANVLEMAKLLKQQARHTEIVKVCEQALAIDPFLEEEELHLVYMAALADEGKTGAALGHYEHLSSLIGDDLGATPAPALRDYYRLLKTEVERVELNLSAITEKLRERRDFSGGFSCDRDFFRLLYRLELRRGDRSDNAVLLGLLTITKEDHSFPGPEELTVAARKAAQVLDYNLRRGDAYCQWNRAQFLVLLPGLGHQDAGIFLDRIGKEFMKWGKTEGLDLKSQVQPLLPHI